MRKSIYALAFVAVNLLVLGGLTNSASALLTDAEYKADLNAECLLPNRIVNPSFVGLILLTADDGSPYAYATAGTPLKLQVHLMAYTCPSVSEYHHPVLDTSVFIYTGAFEDYSTIQNRDGQVIDGFSRQLLSNSPVYARAYSAPLTSRFAHAIGTITLYLKADLPNGSYTYVIDTDRMASNIHAEIAPTVKIIFYTQEFANSIIESVATPYDDEIKYKYTIAKDGSYAATTVVKYYITGKSACGSASSPCGSVSIPLHTSNSIYSSYTTTAADAGKNVCQTLYYSPKSASDAGWGSKELCAVANSSYTNSVTSTATPAKVATGDTTTFKHTIAKTGGGSTATTVKYYITGKSACGSASSPCGTVSLSSGGTSTVSKSYTTTVADANTNVCQTIYFSPKSSTDSSWGSKQVCAGVYIPWEITATTTMSSSQYTTKTGGVKVPTGSSLVFKHDVKANNQKVIDDNDNLVKVDVRVFQYVRGGIRNAVPDKQSQMTTLFEQKDMQSTAINWALLNGKQFTLTVANLEKGKTYCQFVLANKSKRGSSNTAQSNPVCVYIPCN